MAFELMQLPYEKNALAPHISEETLEFHYGKHHGGYVKKLNAAIEGSELEEKTLEEIIKTASNGVFNNAAQIWNHNFYWNSLSPNGGGEPVGVIAEKILAAFGDFEHFKDEFSAKAGGNFGSGWTWLVQNSDGELEIINTDDADTPIKDDDYTPLLVLDIWEHAYYIDYRNARPDYIAAFWNLVNWEFSEGNLR